MKTFFQLLIIAACVGVFILFILPRYESMQSIRSEVASYKERLATVETLTKSRDDLIAKYNTISKADLDALKTLLPDRVDNIRLIIQLDSLATKNGLSSLRNVNYDASTKEATSATSIEGEGEASSQKPYGTFTMSFETSGQYKNFLAFISDLERNLRLVDIVSVDFGVNEGSDRGLVDTFRYKVTLQTYWLKQ